MEKYLAIDQGTTSSRAIIFDSNLEPVADYQQEYSLSYPQDGWVEANPNEILKTVNNSIENVLDQVSEKIASCGITNQRETTVVWSKETGETIYPAIIWQDRRTDDLCKSLKAKGHEEMVKQKTGLVLDPYFSATKIQWILDNVPNARKRAESGELLFGTIDSFLIFNLSKQKNHMTDVTNASRTMLYNISTNQWDNQILKSLRLFIRLNSY